MNRGLGNATAARGAAVRVVALLLVFSAVIVAGYVIFRLFAGGGSRHSTDLVVVAVVAGIASFFSPCVFPLLPAFLSLHHSQAAATDGMRIGIALAAAAGVLTFALLLGGVVGLAVRQSAAPSRSPVPSRTSVYRSCGLWWRSR